VTLGGKHASRRVFEERTDEMKSGRRDKAEGTIDRIAGRVLEAVGRVTGKRSTKAKGKAARGRGAGRRAKGRVKRGRA
jgi:uncharacterized protein YjbJ (UPF0337 family)